MLKAPASLISTVSPLHARATLSSVPNSTVVVVDPANAGGLPALEASPERNITIPMSAPSCRCIFLPLPLGSSRPADRPARLHGSRGGVCEIEDLARDHPRPRPVLGGQHRQHRVR